MKLRFIILAALACAVVAADAPSESTPSLKAFTWLEGKWARQSQKGEVIESWERVSNVTMEGTATRTSEGQTRVTEYLRIELLGDDIFYTAKPIENPYPTPFKLVSVEANRSVFENPTHDFPQRIIYTRDGERRMVVRIEGPDGDGVRGIDFHFERKN